MAKKKTIDLRSVEPTPVPAGDVNIIYNGTRIAGFSEDTEATLKTGGTRVLHDINVNYTKSIPDVAKIVIANHSSHDLVFEEAPPCINFDPIVYVAPESLSNTTRTLYAVPILESDDYRISFKIMDGSDELEVSSSDMSIRKVTLGDPHYWNCEYRDTVYPTELHITITDKAAE